MPLGLASSLKKYLEAFENYVICLVNKEKEPLISLTSPIFISESSL